MYELQTRRKQTIILPQNKLPESHNVHSLHQYTSNRYDIDTNPNTVPLMFTGPCIIVITEE